jgi:hypothetical protein
VGSIDILASVPSFFNNIGTLPGDFALGAAVEVNAGFSEASVKYGSD